MKSWDLRYFLSPKLIESVHGRVDSISLERNILDATGGSVTAVGTGQLVNFPAQLVFKSVGYISHKIEGMEDIGVVFDTTKHIVPNKNGRVTTLDGFVPGVYASGWVKNGPVGVIATTMYDAFETADALTADWLEGQSFLNETTPGAKPGWSALKHLSRKRAISWSGWKQIEEIEIRRGRSSGKPRDKFTSIDEMLQQVS